MSDGLSTKSVDNMLTTVLRNYKSDIFIRDFYSLPIFYTHIFRNNFNTL